MTQSAIETETLAEPYRGLFEANPQPACVADRETLALLAVNEAMVRRTGFTRAELLSMSLPELHAAEDAARLLAALRTGTVQSFPGGWRTKTREPRREVEIAASAVSFGARPAFLVVGWEAVGERVFARVAETETRLRAIIDSEPECVKLVNPDGTLRDINPAGLAMIEADSLQQVVGRPLVSFVAPAFHAALAELSRRVFEGGTGGLTFEAVGLKGTRRWLETRAVPLRDADGNVNALLGITRDITERRRAEEERDRLAAIVDSSDDAIVSVTLDGTVSTWNGGARRLYGFEAAEMIGSPVARLAPHPDRDEVAVLLVGIGRGERISHYRTTRRCRSGSSIAVSLSLSPVHNAEGQIVGAAMIARDISAQKEADERLRRSEQQLARAQALAQMGSWEWDIAADVVRWSDESYRIFGLVPQSVPLRYDDYIARVHPEDRTRANELVQASVVSGRPFAFEQRICRPSGEIRTVYARGELQRDSAGVAQRLTGTVEDITERRRAEEALMRSRSQLRELAARLDSAREEERTRISRQIHDEVGQALTALKIGLSGLTTQMPKRSTALARRARELTSMVDEMLASTQRIGLELRPGILDVLGIPAAIQWAVDDFQRRTGLTCHASVPAQTPPLDGDTGTVIFRILQEALTNVARHAGASLVNIQFRVDAGAIELTVEDNGRGITLEEMTNARSLGLLGVRERTEARGGEVVIDGQPGRGTSVRVRIPTTPPREGRPQ